MRNRVERKEESVTNSLKRKKSKGEWSGVEGGGGRGDKGDGERRGI